MLTVDKRPDGILHVQADGQLTTEDYVAFVSRFERLAEPSSPILIDLGPEFTGWTLGALWRDLKFDVEHQRQLGRIAVVGDKKWEKWGTEASAIIFPGEIRFVENEAAADAVAWLLSPSREKTR